MCSPPLGIMRDFLSEMGLLTLNAGPHMSCTYPIRLSLCSWKTVPQGHSQLFSMQQATPLRHVAST